MPRRARNSASPPSAGWVRMASFRSPIASKSSPSPIMKRASARWPVEGPSRPLPSSSATGSISASYRARKLDTAGIGPVVANQAGERRGLGRVHRTGVRQLGVHGREREAFRPAHRHDVAVEAHVEVVDPSGDRQPLRRLQHRELHEVAPRRKSLRRRQRGDDTDAVADRRVGHPEDAGGARHRGGQRRRAGGIVAGQLHRRVGRRAVAAPGRHPSPNRRARPRRRSARGW